MRDERTPPRKRESLFSDLNDAKAIVQGGNPNNRKARRFLASTLDRAMMRIVDAEALAALVMHARDSEKAAKRILRALRSQRPEAR